MINSILNKGLSMLMPIPIHAAPHKKESDDERYAAMRDKLREEYAIGFDCPDTLDDEGVVYEWE